MGEIELTANIAAALAILPYYPSLCFDLSEAISSFRLSISSTRVHASEASPMRTAIVGSRERRAGAAEALYSPRLERRTVARRGWEFDLAQCSSFQLASGTLQDPVITPSGAKFVNIGYSLVELTFAAAKALKGAANG
ncbi:hypothetical protein IB267_17530 [Ensifer sp. ENS09]|uniref:hypothetical protein n=1 Tax=Ensifer sp. ENS09 TaxID=2769263 RepID=UPI00177DCC98|nr:hypothetical protein [Ensifer sp. ENS09]MBD9650154.1 hypothetical protein [Ensifer sp. ENS09]